jgi:hypothetical protein
MEADLYLDLSIGGTGGSGTSGSPYQSFADVPAYAGGADKNILVTGDAALSGTQTIKGGYNYFARSLQEICSTTSEGVFGLDNVAYDTTFQLLAFNGRWNDSNDNINQTTFNNCRFRRAMTATNRYFYIHRKVAFNFCWFSGGCAAPGNNQGIFLQASLGNNTPYPTFVATRCNFYLKAAGVDGSESIFPTTFLPFVSNTLTKCLFHAIDTNGQVSSTSYAYGVGNYYAGDVTMGINISGDDFLFIDPENHNLSLADNSPVLAL